VNPVLGALARCGAGLAAALPCAALAADSLVVDLEQRLARGSVASVNEYLSEPAAGAATMSRLHRQTAACELQAVSLTVRLARDGTASAVQAHEDALRAASGRCARFVLALVSSAEVPKVCASRATWGAAQTARELRRRMSEIDADKLLAATAHGKACRAAYQYEMKNTRVTLRAVLPAGAR
jgi:hypothetical protein